MGGWRRLRSTFWYDIERYVMVAVRRGDTALFAYWLSTGSNRIEAPRKQNAYPPHRPDADTGSPQHTFRIESAEHLQTKSSIHERNDPAGFLTNSHQWKGNVLHLSFQFYNLLISIVIYTWNLYIVNWW